MPEARQKAFDFTDRPDALLPGRYKNEEDQMKYQVVCDKKSAFGNFEPTILVGVSPMTTYPVTQNPIFDDIKDAEKFKKELEDWAAVNNPINEQKYKENPNKHFLVLPYNFRIITIEE